MNRNRKKLKIGEEVNILSGYPFNSKLFNNEKKGKPIIRIRDILNSSIDTFYSGIYSDAFLIKEGDILVGMDGEFHVSKWKNIDSLLNQRILKIYQKKDASIDIEYFFYFLFPFLEKIHNITPATTVKHLSTFDIKKAEHSFPPIHQQRKIAKILNTADAVIEKTEEAIAKYNALKQGMMQDLFTRGIDLQNGQLRPAYNDAPHLYKETELGWIPKEWEVEQFGDMINGKGVYGINAAAVDYDPEKYAYLRITDISENGYFIADGRKSVDHPEAKAFLLSEGDIVFARTGNSTGKTYLYDPSDGKLVFAGFLIKFHPNPDLLIPEFIKFYTETNWYWNWVDVYSARTGQPGINGNEYGKLPLPVPPVKEQYSIVHKLSSINRKIESENRSLAKHQSLKKGLMQDLLTGKVEVEV